MAIDTIQKAGVYGEYVLSVILQGYQIPTEFINSCVVIESINNLQPRLSMEIVNPNNFLQTMRFSGHGEVEIEFGKSEEYTKRLVFYISDIPGNIVRGQGASSVQINGFLKESMPFIKNVAFYGWNGTFSSILQEILPNIKITNTNIDATDDSRNWICAGWTLSNFVNYARLRVRSAAGKKSAGYLHFFDSDGYFNFRSLQNIYADDVQQTFSSGIMDPPESVEKQHYYIINYSSANNLYRSSINSAGISGVYFDEKDCLGVDGSATSLDAVAGVPSSVISVPTTTLKKLNIAIAEEDPAGALRYMGSARTADDEEMFQNIIDSHIINEMYNALRLSVIVDGDVRLCAGDTVIVDFNVSEETETDTWLSGKWVVSDITHNIKPQYTRSLTLIRPGFDSKELDHLVAV